MKHLVIELNFALLRYHNCKFNYSNYSTYFLFNGINDTRGQDLEDLAKDQKDLTDDQKDLTKDQKDLTKDQKNLTKDQKNFTMDEDLIAYLAQCDRD